MKKALSSYFTRKTKLTISQLFKSKSKLNNVKIESLY